MARDLKDELMGTPTNGASPEQTMVPPQPGNIQLELDDRLQRLAVNVVIEDFEAAKASRENIRFGITSKGITLTHETWLKELRDLYFQDQRIPKNLPWKFCSNRSMMIAMSIVETLVARILPAVYNEDLIRWRPKDVIYVDKAESIEKLMSWWIRVHLKMRDFFERWTRYTIGFGRTLTETTWDVQLVDKGESTPSQPIMDETNQPLTNPDGSPAVMGSEKILDRIEKTRSDVIPEEDIFLHSSATDIQRDPVIIRKKFLYRDLEEMEREGKVVNVSQPTAEGGRLLKDLLLVSGTSAGVSGLTPQETEEVRNIKRRNVPVEVLEWWGGVDLDGDGFPEQVRLLVCPAWQVYLGGIALKDISSRGIRPLDLTLYNPRLDEPHGLRGLGVLEQVKELAQEVDAIFNQMTDANTMMVMKPGFYDPSGDLNAPNLTIAPNKWSPVTDPQRNIYIPQMDSPTEKLLEAVKMVMEFIERLTASGSTLFGNDPTFVGGPGTATRTQAIEGAANQRFGLPTGRMREGAASIMTQHLDILQKNLPPGLEERILGMKNEPIFDNPVTKESVLGEYDCYLLPDDTLGSKEAERQLTQMLYALLLNNPLVVTDPAKIYKPTADILKAWGKDPTQYLGPEPPINELLDPQDENQLMISGDFSKVKATALQNPLEHIITHQQILQNPWLLAQTPEIQQQILMYAQGHIQEHIQLMQTMIAIATRIKKAGGSNASVGGGTQPGAGGGAQAVGPEPSMGSVQNPLAAAGAAQRTGEVQTSPPQ